MNIETIKRLCPEFANKIDIYFQSDFTESFYSHEIIVLQALAEARQALEWRPIESAPKDGTRILARMDGAVFVCRWENWFWISGWTIYLERKDSNFIRKCFGNPDCWLLSQPTEWRPLDAPSTPPSVQEGA